MVYFLVNNTYHLVDLEKHLPSLGVFPIGVIQVPHTLDASVVTRLGLESTLLPALSTGRLSDLAPWRILSVRRAVRSKMHVAPNDSLVMYSEYDITNHILAEHFFRQGAKIYLLEEGLATYLESGFHHTDFTSRRRRILYWFVRLFAGLRHSRLSHSDTFSAMFLKDEVFKSALLYLDFPLLRKIDRVLVKKDYEKVGDLDKQSVIFLNEDNYVLYESRASYLAGLNNLMRYLSSAFKVVYFKFHPREYQQNPETVVQIRKVLADYTNISIIESKYPIEGLISQYRAGYVVSYMSIGLINLAYYGLEPIFVHTLFPKLKEHRDFRRITAVLERLNYNFIQKFEQLSPNYESGLSTEVDAVDIASVLS